MSPCADMIFAVFETAGGSMNRTQSVTHRFIFSLFLLAALVLTVTNASAQRPAAKLSLAKFLFVWPVSGGVQPDLPMSSAFGPRLKASEDYRYDFHRGVDIPTPMGTPLHAIADGVVRLAGDYPFYTDTVVQLRHYKPGTGARTCSNRGCYYSNYMHLDTVAVQPGDVVSKGDVIGYSGASESGFEHLHFEIRNDGIYQENAINPWQFLPYDNTANLAVAIQGQPDLTDPLRPLVDVSVSSDSAELDFNRIEIAIYEINDTDQILISSQEVDFNQWNAQYTPRDNPSRFLDDPTFNNVSISPAVFNARSDSYRMGFSFNGLQLEQGGGRFRIEVRVFGVNDTTPVAIDTLAYQR